MNKCLVLYIFYKEHNLTTVIQEAIERYEYQTW